MALTPGTRLGPYEVTSQLGVGGMGEVYRARDSRLQRDVALKVLPDAFAHDPDRLARFEREAKALAALNHPNIAQVYGLETSEGAHALVMELVEGPTLADRITHGAIPIDEALPVAAQIAEALVAAHEQGIVHRDLKPANIKVRPDGTVKVLDFGLAKLVEPGTMGGPDARSTGLSQSPTITSPAMTRMGVILGTAAYMSPEQARGAVVDRRADLWAFGAVLYEMLTARRAFDGSTVSDTLASVLKTEPDWTALPPGTPAPIRRLLRRCLQKDRKRRLADASDARLEIDDSLAAPAGGRDGTQNVPPTGWRRVAALAVGGIVAGSVLGAGAMWTLARSAPPPPVTRLTIPLDGATQGATRTFAISPDGTRVAYSGGPREIFVRDLGRLEPTAVSASGAPGARSVFMSPDGDWIGFFDQSGWKKVPVAGGAPVALSPTDGTAPRGATWGTDGTIVFATDSQVTGLRRVSAAGGDATVLTTPNVERGEGDHLFPYFLPGGRAVLFTVRPRDLDPAASIVAVLDLQTGAQKVLVRGGSDARYVPTGHLVYAAGGALRAVKFDPVRLEVAGTPVTVVEQVATSPFGIVMADVSESGTLVYVTGDVGTLDPRTMVWVDRQGHEEALPAPPRPYLYPRLSPDGTRVAVSSLDQEQDVWLWDLTRATLTRLTFEPRTDYGIAWTPDGQRLLLGSARLGGQLNVWVQAADGTGSATRLTDSPNQQIPSGTTPDGTRVVVHERMSAGHRDLRLLTLTPTPRLETLLATRFEERGGVVSPDGRWLAYESDSSGRFEVYVRPFPTVGDGQWQVSTSGGMMPLWARNGRELFYALPDGALMAVPVDPRASTWSAGAPTQVVKGGYFIGTGINVSRHYDVSADGQRFLMLKESDSQRDTPNLIVVQNWFEELKRLVPAN